MKFTMENEIDNTNNFLDITIQKGIENLSFDIYIENPSRLIYYTKRFLYPPEYKHAAIRYLVYRMNSYSLTLAKRLRTIL